MDGAVSWQHGTKGWGLSQRPQRPPAEESAPEALCPQLHSWPLLLSPRKVCQLIPAQHLAGSFHFLRLAWLLSHLSSACWRGFLVPWRGVMEGRIRGCPGREIPRGPTDGNEMKGAGTEFVLGERARGRWRAGGGTKGGKGL